MAIAVRPRPGFAYLAGAPMLVAHRGGGKLAPENTLPAFTSAVEDWGADMLEMDVRLTADGVVVVIHDDTVDRTTDGTGLVSEMTLEQIHSLDAGYHFTDLEGNTSFRGVGVAIPTLEAVMEACPDVCLNVEAKEAAVAGPLVDLVRGRGQEHRVLVAAELERNRRSVRGYPGPWGASRRDCLAFWLFHRLPGGRGYTPSVDIFQVPEYWKGRRVLTPRLIEEAHLRNIPVQVWTVDDPAVMKRLLSWGVDGIQSGRPDLLSEVLVAEVGRPLPPILRRGGMGPAGSGPGLPPARPREELVEGVRRRVEDLIAPAGAPTLVALSGGLDSCVLLHLLRFALPARPLFAVHFDHAMRDGSSRDADWVAGLCRSWSVPLRSGKAIQAPTSEDAARRARYAYLEEVRKEVGGGWLLTGHHADDQAETVLFRVLRGTGLDGLRGIPPQRAPDIARPLLDAWREDLEAYARSVGLTWREDPTNEHLGYARNVLRHRLIPEAESEVAPGARAALVRLAAHATDDAEAWADALALLLTGADLQWQRGEHGEHHGASLEYSSLEGMTPALRARVLRHVASHLGYSLPHGATGNAAAFLTSARSGAGMDLGGGLELRRELDRVVIQRPSHAVPDRPIVVRAAEDGGAEGVLGGRELQVSWSVGGRSDPVAGIEDPAIGIFAVADVAFPLRLRGRSPGDRIRLGGGTSKVKKLMLESRIPAGGRDRVPVLEDDAGRILWIPGVARSVDARPARGEAALTIRIQG